MQLLCGKRDARMRFVGYNIIYGNSVPLSVRDRYLGGGGMVGVKFACSFYSGKRQYSIGYSICCNSLHLFFCPWTAISATVPLIDVKFCTMVELRSERSCSPSGGDIFRRFQMRGSKTVFGQFGSLRHL